MFFCPPYTYTPCGMFTVGHLVLFLVTVIGVAAGLYLTRHLDARRVRLTVRIVTALLWALEVAKILFVLLVTKSDNPNDFIPLYYCSLILYAGLFSSVGKGFWQKLGDVFIATGGVMGGICFLIYPSTSLPRYPTFHFISFHSFLLHGLMVFLGLLLLLRGVYRIRLGDIPYCAGLVSAISAVAYLFNLWWDHAHPDRAFANLMFVSKDFPSTPISILYRLTGPLFPVVMWLVQAFVPFLLFVLAQRVIDAVRIRKNIEI